MCAKSGKAKYDTGWDEEIDSDERQSSNLVFFQSSTLSFHGVPYIIAAIISLFGAVVTILLPETSDMKLLTTVDEMEKFGEETLFAFYRRKSVQILMILKPKPRRFSRPFARKASAAAARLASAGGRIQD